MKFKKLHEHGAIWCNMSRDILFDDKMSDNIARDQIFAILLWEQTPVLSLQTHIGIPMMEHIL